jgi:hypothetical protein
MNADLEELIEQNSDIFAEHYDLAMRDPSSRDLALWAAAETDVNATIEDFSSVPLSRRGDEWTLAFTSFVAAAQMQALADSGILAELVKLSEKNGDRVNGAARKAGATGLLEAVGELPGSGITEQVKAERRASAEAQ